MINKKFIKLIYLILVFSILGCGKVPQATKSRDKELRDKQIAIIRKNQIKQMQRTELMQLAQFNKDMDILKKRNPFNPSAVSYTEGPGLDLTGIIRDEKGLAAIINDLIVSEGDMVGDKKVEKITERSVLLTEDGEEYLLELKVEE